MPQIPRPIMLLHVAVELLYTHHPPHHFTLWLVSHCFSTFHPFTTFSTPHSGHSEVHPFPTAPTRATFGFSMLPLLIVGLQTCQSWYKILLGNSTPGASWPPIVNILLTLITTLSIGILFLVLITLMCHQRHSHQQPLSDFPPSGLTAPKATLRIHKVGT